jgi:hypothetical protein
MDTSIQLTHSLLGRDAQLFGALRFALDTANQATNITGE